MSKKAVMINVQNALEESFPFLIEIDHAGIIKTIGTNIKYIIPEMGSGDNIFNWIQLDGQYAFNDGKKILLNSKDSYVSLTIKIEKIGKLRPGLKCRRNQFFYW